MTTTMEKFLKRRTHYYHNAYDVGGGGGGGGVNADAARIYTVVIPMIFQYVPYGTHHFCPDIFVDQFTSLISSI